MEKIVFLGYIVNEKGIEMNDKKIRAIQKYPTPKSITKVISFYGLTSFYKRFVKDLSTLVAPLTKIVKKSMDFKWGKEQVQAFSLLKAKLISAPLLSLPNFTKNFEIECDTSKLDIKVIL